MKPILLLVLALALASNLHADDANVMAISPKGDMRLMTISQFAGATNTSFATPSVEYFSVEDTNTAAVASKLETRTLHLGIASKDFHAHLTHFMAPRDGEEDFQLLKRFFEKQKVNFDTLVFNKRKVILYARATKADLDKIEELVVRIQDDIPLSTPMSSPRN